MRRSPSSTSQPVAPGASIPSAVVGAAGARGRGTPATDGANTTPIAAPPSEADGAETLPLSPNPNTQTGSAPEPASVPEVASHHLPFALASCASLLYREKSALEIAAFINTPLRVTSQNGDSVELDPGDWLLVRMPSSKAEYCRGFIPNPFSSYSAVETP